MSAERPVAYLGDGVYAAFDGWQIALRVERGGRAETVYLEPGVYHALVLYADGLGFSRPEREGG